MKGMKKMVIVLLVVLLIIPIAYAVLPTCERIINVGEPCMVVSPAINCSNTTYTYSIINMTGFPVVMAANLTSLNGSFYYFNFTLTSFEADYKISLCDGSSESVKVENAVVIDTQARVKFFGIILLLAIALTSLGFYTNNGTFAVGGAIAFLISSAICFMVGLNGTPESVSRLIGILCAIISIYIIMKVVTGDD